MSENESGTQKPNAIIINPTTEKILGQVSLVGDPVPATEWISTNGAIQSFVIVEGKENLKEIWAQQAVVLLRTTHGQRFIKIVTYPSEGENQGYLDYTSDFVISPKLMSERKTRLLTQRGFAFLQSLFSAQ